ncbi:MAG: hypothetical protein KGQ68_07460 [Gammaproteobacteria bacterium]|nr:hypothetical protein [Gammaproteobacteria bacterium]MDE2024577.1 hypothetical protein [Gammaproteobacteria bacterium]
MNMKVAAQFDAAQVRALRMLLGIFGLVWLVNAVFQAMAWLAVPDAKANFIHALAKPASKVPAWIQPLLLAAVHGAQAIGAEIVAGAMILIAILLGVALLARRQVALAARVGIVYSIICWVFLNGFGFHYSNGQTDPGVFVAYAIAFLFVLSAAPVLQGRGADVPGPSLRLWNAARIAFGLLWLFDAVLKWVPAFWLHFTSQITSVIPGQPHWVAAWLTFVAAIVHAVGPVPVAILVALAETAIAFGLLSGKWPRTVIAFGIAYSLLVWVTAEAFGGPYSTAGTGVRGNVLGNVLIYLIPFLFLWVGSRRGGSASAASEPAKSQ